MGGGEQVQDEHRIRSLGQAEQVGGGQGAEQSANLTLSADTAASARLIISSSLSSSLRLYIAKNETTGQVGQIGSLE